MTDPVTPGAGAKPGPGEPCVLLKLGDPHLRALVECFLMDADFVRDFCRAPAGIKNHHAYLGGLLEHVVTLLDGAERLLPLYPNLDRDLLLIEATSLRHLMRLEESLATLERLERVQPRFSRMHQERGLCFVAHRDAPRAIEAFLHAVNINPALEALGWDPPRFMGTAFQNAGTRPHSLKWFQTMPAVFSAVDPSTLSTGRSEFKSQLAENAVPAPKPTVARAIAAAIRARTVMTPARRRRRTLAARFRFRPRWPRTKSRSSRRRRDLTARLASPIARRDARTT